MSSITRFEPWSEMLTLRDAMDRLFEGHFPFPRTTDGMQSFPVDVYEQDDTLIVEADMPGMKPEEVDVQLQGDQLFITGKSVREEEKKEQQFYRRERAVQRYSRLITLPVSVEADKVEATFEDGCLKVRLHKSELSRTHRIPIKASTGSNGG